MPPKIRKKSGLKSWLWPFSLSGGIAPEPEPAPADGPFNILVVTRDSGLVAEIRGGLADRGFQFTFVRDREGSRDEIRQQSPHLVLIDWRLSGNEARNLTRSVRQGRNAPPARVLAVAPRSVPSMIAEILAAGCDDFLTMPFDLRELNARINMLLRRNATTRRLRDGLTGLLSRSVILERLGEAIEEAERGSKRVPAILYCDIDRFKYVNDGLGPKTGDRLLCAAARRLQHIARPEDSVGRIGGDEFVVVLEDAGDTKGAGDIADAIRSEFDVPFELDGREVFASMTIGLAVWEPGYDDPLDLLRDADTAKYRAKETGRNQTVVFDGAMRVQVIADLELENDLRRAVARQEFVTFYQPIVSIPKGMIVGFEALLRWRHPERGVLAPAKFTDTAERMGAIIQMDRWVVEDACRQLRAWQTHHRHLLPLTVAVNISGTHFHHHDLVRHIDMILRNTGLYGESLQIEVTESMLVSNAEYAAQMLDQLRSLNIGISLDDFGTGYSSLAYLRRFKIDTIKIDRSFVSTMLEDPDSSEIVKTVISLAKNLGKETVAEGVETVSQFEVLRDLGVDHVQGHLIAPAMPVDAAEEFLVQGVFFDELVTPDPARLSEKVRRWEAQSETPPRVREK